jgi:hypothetical protein
MKDALVDKLTAKLSKPITTEADVVYVLVEIRKLLARCNVSRDDLKPIWFFCDWVVHIELDRKKGWANELLTFTDRILRRQISWNDLDPIDKDFMSNTFSLEAVRRSLSRWLADQGVRTIVFGYLPGWYWFVRKFGEVVSDCPLKLKGGDYIEEVTLQIVPGNASGTRLDMEWTFRRRDSPDPFKWIIPTFFEKESYNFGRNGARLAAEFDAELRKAGLVSPWEAEIRA